MVSEVRIRSNLSSSSFSSEERRRSRLAQSPEKNLEEGCQSSGVPLHLVSPGSGGTLRRVLGMVSWSSTSRL